MSNPVRVTVQISANSETARGPELRPAPGGQGVRCDGAGQTFAVSYALPATASLDELRQQAEFRDAVQAAAQGFSETIVLYGPEPVPSPGRSSKALLESVFYDAFGEASSMQVAVAMSCVDIQADGAVSDRLANATITQFKKETFQVLGQKTTRRRAQVWSSEEAIALLNLADAPPMCHLLVRIAFRSIAAPQSYEGLLTVAFVRSPPDISSDQAAAKLLKTDNMFKQMLTRFTTTAGLADGSQRRKSSLNTLLHDSLQRNSEIRMVIFIPPRLGPRTRETLLLAEKLVKVAHSREKREADPSDDWGISSPPTFGAFTNHPGLPSYDLRSSPSFGCAQAAAMAAEQVAAEDAAAAEGAAASAMTMAAPSQIPVITVEDTEATTALAPIPTAGAPGATSILRHMIEDEQRKWEEFLANVRKPLVDDGLLLSPTATPASRGGSPKTLEVVPKTMNPVHPMMSTCNSVEELQHTWNASPLKHVKSSSLPATMTSMRPPSPEFALEGKTEGGHEDKKEIEEVVRYLKDEVSRLQLQVQDLNQVKVQQQQQLDESRAEVSQLRAELLKRPPVDQKQKENLVALGGSPNHREITQLLNHVAHGIEEGPYSPTAKVNSPTTKVRPSRDVILSGPGPVRPPLDVIPAGQGMWTVQNTVVTRNRQREMQNCFMEDLRSQIVLGPTPAMANLNQSWTPALNEVRSAPALGPAVYVRSPTENVTSNKEVILDTDKLSADELSRSLQDLATRTPLPARILAVGSKAPALMEDVQRMGPARAGRPPTEIIRRLKCPALTSQSLLLTGAPDPRAVGASVHAHAAQLTEIRWSGPPSTALFPCAEEYHAEIFSSLPSAVRLETLSITNSAAPQTSMQLLADKLPLLPALRELDLGGMELGPDGVKLLAKGFARCPKLEVLTLRRCGLGPKGATNIAHWLSVLGTLNELDVAENCIGSDAAVSILTVIPLCPQLATVNLSANGLSDKVAAFWYGAMQRGSPDVIARVKILGF